MPLKIQTGIINYEPKTDGLLFSFAAMSNEQDRELLNVMGRLGMIWKVKISENFESEKTELNKNFSAEFNEFITSSYYDPTKLEDFEINKNFEELLEKINQWLKIKRINNVRLEEFIEALNVTIFVFLNQEINFSQIGFNRHFLIRPSEEAVELSQANKKKIVPFAQNKFSNVINGDLEQDNLLILFTEEFIKYYDYNKLSDLLTEGISLKEVLSKIKKSVSEKKYEEPFSLILLKLSSDDEYVHQPAEEEPEPEKENINRAKNTSEKINKQETIVEPEKDETIKEIQDNKDKSEEQVQESTAIESKNKSGKATEIKNETEAQIPEEKIEEKEPDKTSTTDEKIKNLFVEEEKNTDNVFANTNEVEKPKKTLFVNLIKGFFRLIKFIIRLIGRGIKLLLNFLTKILFIQSACHKFKKLTLQQKLAVIFSFILGLAFIGGLFYNIKLNYHTNNSREYRDLISNLENKEKEIQQTIALKDETKIGSLYSDFRELIKSLPNMTESQKNEYNAIQQRVYSQFKSALKENKPSQVKILADFQSAQADLLNALIYTTKKLYVLDQNTQTIYAIDALDGQKTAIYKAPANSSKIIKLRLADQDNLLILYDNQKLSNINLLDNKLINFSLETKNKNLKISDLFVYSQKLYILDNTSGKIFKYTKTLNGFSREEEWLKAASPDLIGALNFTSDGSVYVLTADNKIKKFYTGQEQTFNFKITPPLSGSSNKILTFYGNNYVYILNPEYERIILVNKDGKVIKIIGDPEIKNALDFQVNEKNKKIWISAKDKILEYEI
ncbi:MAG: hypothetical protein AAB465_03055 [Patescibacteria group bacterium]